MKRMILEMEQSKKMLNTEIDKIKTKKYDQGGLLHQMTVEEKDEEDLIK